MPADIIGGLVGLINTQLGYRVWTGEIPKQTPAQVNIDESQFPVFALGMTPAGLDREWTTDDPYTDAGPLGLQVFHSTLGGVMTALNALENVLANSANWAITDLGDGTKYELHQLLIIRWYAGQVEEVRTRNGGLLFLGEFTLLAGIRGAVATR